MPRARVGDVTLNYAVHGSGDWVVLIGGFASGNWQAWGTQLAELSKTYRVLAFDSRGIGDSDAPDSPYTTRMMARDTLGLMEHLGIERAHVLGKSLGGAIGQWVALEQPDRVRSLAMTSTFARLDRRAARMVTWWLATARGAGFEALFPGLLTYFFTAEYCDTNSEALARAESALLATRRPLHGFVNTGNAVLTHDTWDRLGEIAVPALLLCGAEDIITPPRHTEAMGRRLPKADVHIIPRTLHGFLTEKPETFELILDFFRRH